MPILQDREKNIQLELNLHSGDGIDIEKERPDSKNWIPFEFVLTVEVDKYRFVEGGIPCFTLWEIKKIIDGFCNIVHVMKETSQRLLFEDRFEVFEHTCYEVYFDIQVYDADMDAVGIVLWINMGYVRGVGYKKGFDFVVDINDFENFTFNLHKEYKNILDNYNC